MALSIFDITEINEYRWYFSGSYYIPVFVLKTTLNKESYDIDDTLTADDVQVILSTHTLPIPLLGGYDNDTNGVSEMWPQYSGDYYTYISTEKTYNNKPSYQVSRNQMLGDFSWSSIGTTTISGNTSYSYRTCPFIVRYLDSEGEPYTDTGYYCSTTINSSDNLVITQPSTMISSLKMSNRGSTTIKVTNTVTTILGESKPYNPDNPYENAGDNPEDPGQGEFDYDSDEIPIPDIPSVSVTATGFVTLYTPSATELKNLASYLWSDLFSLDTFKKMFNNPMDCILGLTIVPLNLPTGAAQEITVGNIVTTVSCTTCPTQYVTVDCGSFTFSKKAFTGSYLDYSPYNKVFLYLPYIGIQEIDVDEFMGGTMSIVYHVDILTGAMFCYVSSTNAKGTERVIYTFSGACAENVPLSSNDFSTTISSIMGVVNAVAGTVATIATGGGSAPVAAKALAKGVVSTANNVINSKPSISHSGSLGGGSGIMGVQYPYLIFNAPWLSTVNEQSAYTGFASNTIVNLSDLSGYNVIEAINLSVQGATDTECDEIKRILMEGVII